MPRALSAATRVPAAAASAVLLLGGGALVAAGCGGGGGGATTPATTVADGRNVYDPEHRMVILPPGPKFIIRMPDPGEGQVWRLFTPENTGGVALKGLQNASGSGDWYFETIGAGAGTLEFRRTGAGNEDSSESVTYEVKIG